MSRLNILINWNSALAMKYYNAHFHAGEYLRATEGRTTEQANELIDAAMALSGHPRFDMPDCGWTDEETDFLMLFAKEG